MDAPHSTRRRVLRGLLGTAAVVLSSGGPGESAEPGGERATRVTLSDLNGARVTLPDAYAGKVIIVHFWASWCRPCLREIEALESLQGEARERGVVPVSINVGETKAAVLEALRNRTVGYPILLDSDSAAARLYGVRGVPTTFVVDRAGAIGVKILGEIDRRALRQILAGMR